MNDQGYKYDEDSDDEYDAWKDGVVTFGGRTYEDYRHRNDRDWNDGWGPE